MLRFIVLVQTIDQLEILLDATKTLGLSPELGSEPLPLPSVRPRRSTKVRAKGKHGKRRSGHMSVRASVLSDGPPRVIEASHILRSEFGGEPFKKKDAIPVLMKKMKLKNRPTGYLTQLMDRGGLTAA